MRRFIAVALLAAGMALPACAQRGGGHGGFSGHAGGGFHGGFGGSAPSGFSRPGFSSPRFSGSGFSGSGFSGSRFSGAPFMGNRGSFRSAPSYSAYSRSGFGANRGR